MQIADLLSADRTSLDQSSSSKKSLLEKAAELLARAPDSAPRRDIFEGLCQRERLGSTGLGHGVAIPHCRVDQRFAAGALIRLKRPIDFDGPDAQKVDLFFALAVPSECTDLHLKLLATVAELFSQADQREQLRQAGSYEHVTELLTGYSAATDGQCAR